MDRSVLAVLAAHPNYLVSSENDDVTSGSMSRLKIAYHGKFYSFETDLGGLSRFNEKKKQ